MNKMVLTFNEKLAEIKTTEEIIDLVKKRLEPIH